MSTPRGTFRSNNTQQRVFFLGTQHNCRSCASGDGPVRHVVSETACISIAIIAWLPRKKNSRASSTQRVTSTHGGLAVSAFILPAGHLFNLPCVACAYSFLVPVVAVPLSHVSRFRNFFFFSRNDSSDGIFLVASSGGGNWTTAVHTPTTR